MNQKGMEMAIQVVIVFFVAVAVALIVINLASQMIGRGQEQIKEFKLDCTAGKLDFFVETKTAGSNTIAMLADRCYKDNKGMYSGDKICYIVHSIDPVSLDAEQVKARLMELNQEITPENIETTINFDSWDIDPTGKTVYIKFIQLTQSVSIAS